MERQGLRLSLILLDSGLFTSVSLNVLCKICPLIMVLSNLDLAKILIYQCV